MKRLFPSISLILLILVLNLASSVLSKTAQECYQKGFQNCLSLSGDCTTLDLNCSQACIENNYCYFGCCYMNFCAYESVCATPNDTTTADESSTSSSDKFIVIGLPVIFGVILLFMIVAFVYKVCNKKKANSVTFKVTQAEANMINQNRNNRIMMNQQDPQNQQIIMNERGFQQNNFNNQAQFGQQQSQFQISYKTATPYQQGITPAQQNASSNNNQGNISYI